MQSRDEFGHAHLHVIAILGCELALRRVAALFAAMCAAVVGRLSDPQPSPRNCADRRGRGGRRE
jgi:hypothetical protein